MSLPSRERGLKYIANPVLGNYSLVAPFAGAWIEISAPKVLDTPDIVAPFAGAWIEIATSLSLCNICCVAPFAGAWIEINKRGNRFTQGESLPSRERGLKCCISFCVRRK